MLKLPRFLNTGNGILLLIYISFAAILFILLMHSFNFNDKDVPRVQIPDGKLKGFRMYSTEGRPIDAFTSIPFASPPIGQLRFKPPVPPIPWSEERDATKDVPFCPQFSPYEGDHHKFIGEEDCLYINVFRPKDPKYKNSLPVLVYIYGGGFYAHSSSIQNYGPQIILNQDLILVTFNHRLEMLGFLYTQNEDAPGNYGYKDQVAALRWVQKNIKYFGGDPSRVTLYGQSSGAYSAQYHMLSPLSKGLFHRAVSWSGTIYMLYPKPNQESAEKTRKLAEYVNCPTHNSKLLVECMRNVPAKEMFSHIGKFNVWDREPQLVFGPVVEEESNNTDLDGPFITSKSLLYQNITIPWITGLVSEEGLINTYAVTPDKLAELNRRFNELAPLVFRYEYSSDKKRITNSLKQYFLKQENISRQTIPQLTDLSGTKLLREFSLELSNMVLIFHHNKPYRINTNTHVLLGILLSLYYHKGPVYLYYFTHRGQYSLTDKLFDNPEVHLINDEITSFIKKGVGHGDDLQYVFTQFKSLRRRHNLIFTEADGIVSKRLVQILTDFAYDRLQSNFEWKPTSLENLEYLHIDANECAMKRNLLRDWVQFWYQFKPLSNRHKNFF